MVVVIMEGRRTRRGGKAGLVRKEVQGCLFVVRKDATMNQNGRMV